MRVIIAVTFGFACAWLAWLALSPKPVPQPVNPPNPFPLHLYFFEEETTTPIIAYREGVALYAPYKVRHPDDLKQIETPSYPRIRARLTTSYGAAISDITGYRTDQLHENLGPIVERLRRAEDTHP